MKFSLPGKKPPSTVPRRRLNTERQSRNDALEGRSPKTVSQTIRSDHGTSFRRNQTLTGSRSREIVAANEYSTHTALQSPRAQIHHLRQRRRKFGGVLFGGLLAAAVVAILLTQLTATVRVALYGQIAPLDSEDQARLDAAITTYLDRYPLERLRFLLNEDRLTAVLANNGAREIQRVESVQGDAIGVSVFQLVAREPIASWTIGSDRRFVDAGGVVFSHNYFDVPTVQIRDESGIRVDDENQATAVTSARFLRFIGQAVASLQDQDLQVATVSIPATTTRQVDLLIAKSSRIKMTIDRPAAEQGEDAARAWVHLSGRDQSVRYIDVRVSGKAYYR